ncbi:hypothetical protein [Pusillimonas noertemannii]|uniref:Phage protein n=1 Tax=Pusillimonas noertemannii TaxID=305977 RepID=A0A2U1CS00_9BURK|nr:hypothetical protein [Pusillimonas noertemannii]NYT67969.1 hypothetical protein [Pusillimonas noertemannii]PVY68643.1 hypothetical protein C7440_1054 [Pusillimonas noertemannii]TFL11890.1 hypothetical protein CSC72_01805 [Pusillimonas noertemannii]
MFEDLDLAELGLDIPEDKAAALKEALAAKGKEALDQAVTGLKSKNQELLGTIKTTKTELEQFKTQFDGLDIESVKALLSKASTDEETRLLAEGKIDEVISKRTERLRNDYDKQLNAEKSRADKAEAFANQFKDKVLSDSIREAASKAGALPEAAEDIILRARGTFQLNEHGEPVAVDKDGETIYGKDGKTPLSPLEWAESLRENAPHLWPRVQGAGKTGDDGGKATGKKRSDMSAEEAAAFVQKHGREAYLKLPK